MDKYVSVHPAPDPGTDAGCQRCHQQRNGIGSVVLVAHAVCYACADRPDVLRVWVTAPPSTRASRVASALGLSDKKAARSVRQSDAARASYLKRAYGVGEESPADYDLVINTERLAPDAAAGLILGLVQARPEPPPPAMEQAKLHR